MKRNSQTKRNQPFREWINSFPANRRKPIMEQVAEIVGKKYVTIKSYKNLIRDIPALEAGSIQSATLSISEREGISGFVAAKSIYPELYHAFKQGDQKESHHGTEASTIETQSGAGNAAPTRPTNGECSAQAGVS